MSPKLKSLTVVGLFGRFAYTLSFEDASGRLRPISILTAPNGYGKSTILRMLSLVLSGKYSELASINFSELQLDWTDGTSLAIARNQFEGPSRTVFSRLTVTLINEIGRPIVDPWIFQASKGDTQSDAASKRIDYAQDDSAIERILPHLRPSNIKTYWRDLRDGALLSEDAIRKQIDSVGIFSAHRSQSEEPDWLYRHRARIQVVYIPADRLRDPLRDQTQQSRAAVNRIADQLIEYISFALQEYVDLGRELERRFPEKVFSLLKTSNSNSSDFSSEKVACLISQIAAREGRYRELGLLKEGTSPAVNLGLDDAPVVSVMQAYFEDVLFKLDVLEPSARRIDILLTTLRSHLIFKSVEISREKGLFVASDRGSQIPLDQLSSGEQHLIVLLGQLIFNTDERALVLLDEPEISFHPDWQDKLPNVLRSVVDLNGCSLLIATHSPTVVASRWDDVIELADQVML